MRPRAVVVAHREPMVADALATALNAYPTIVAVAVAITAQDAHVRGREADAVVIDDKLQGAAAAAQGLRRQGVRVVLLGDAAGDEPGVSVPTRAPVSALAAALVPGAADVPATSRLTRREEQILELVARGLAGKEVARELGISPKTVEQHKTRIFAKLGVSNQTAAACVAVATKLQTGRSWALPEPLGGTS